MKRAVATAHHPRTEVRRTWRELSRWLNGHPPPGLVRFGSLRRVRPVAEFHGFHRGVPIDRYYIEEFIEANAGDIRGRVLEVGDRMYSKRYGGQAVTAVDVLHANGTNPMATIVADLAVADNVPSDSFDCIICVQTVQFIYEIHEAMANLHRILKPGGVLLLTTHGISQLDSSAVDRWGEYWRLTVRSTRRLLEETFGAGNVTVTGHGNVLAAISLLHGLTVGELKKSELDHHDPLYEVIVTARAVKGR